MKPLQHGTPDPTRAVEIAPKIWWVGHVLENDPFQCHVYLIENGADSVLIDPGSKLTWPHTREKILSLMPLENIRTIVCHHPDPDITSAVEDFVAEVGTEGRVVVTHWRSAELLEHYGWGLPFYEVQEHGWVLEAGDLRLRFIFTPYMHFPGAICTYEPKTRTLFSSDIFGAVTEEFALYARDAESYFEQMKPFHTHYMPATEIVNHGLDNIESVELERIAPQHGSIIEKPFIPEIIRKLRKLRCGIYMEFKGSRDIELITRINEVLPEVFERAAFFDNFQADTRSILASMRKIFPITKIFALALIDNHHFIKLSTALEKAEPCRRGRHQILETFRKVFYDRKRLFMPSEKVYCLQEKEPRTLYVFPLLDQDKSVFGVGFFVLKRDFPTGEEQKEMLRKFEIAIDIVAKREVEVYRLESEKTIAYAMAITDRLTGLHNRYYLEETVPRELAKAKRYGYDVAFLYVDIDHFKKVNDTYGHAAGDEVLKRFAHIIIAGLRESDMAFRLGGEEFLVVMPHTTAEEARHLGERLAETVREKGCVEYEGKPLCYTFSGGIVDTRECGYRLKDLLDRADEKLYEAKRGGRDRLVM